MDEEGQDEEREGDQEGASRETSFEGSLFCFVGLRHNSRIL